MSRPWLCFFIWMHTGHYAVLTASNTNGDLCVLSQDTATLFCLLLLRAVMPPPLLFVTALYSRWISQQGTNISGAFSQGLQQRTGTQTHTHTHTHTHTESPSQPLRAWPRSRTVRSRQHSVWEKRGREKECIRLKTCTSWFAKGAHYWWKGSTQHTALWPDRDRFVKCEVKAIACLRPGLMTQPSQRSFTLHQSDESNSLLDDEKIWRQATVDEQFLISVHTGGVLLLPARSSVSWVIKSTLGDLHIARNELTKASTVT